VVNYWLSGPGGLGMDLFYGQNDIVPIRIWQRSLMKVVGIYLSFPSKEK